MKNKRVILVIEDDIEDWKNIKEIFYNVKLDEQEIDLFRSSFVIYPDKDAEFYELISNVNFLHSPKDNVNEGGAEFIQKLLIRQNPTCLIIDYELNTDYKENNAFEFYDRMEISIPTVIYTSYTADKFNEIEEQISQSYSDKKIIALQKRDRKTISKQKAKFFLEKIKSLLGGEEEDKNIPEPNYKKIT